MNEDQLLSKTSLEASSIIFCIYNLGSMPIVQDANADQRAKTNKIPDQMGIVKLEDLNE